MRNGNHTPGPWFPGPGGRCVVSHHPVQGGVRGTDDVAYYGGHLVAETVAPDNVPMVAAAPEMAEALAALVRMHGERGTADRLLRPEQQTPEITTAMLLLERLGILP